MTIFVIFRDNFELRNSLKYFDYEANFHQALVSYKKHTKRFESKS